MNDSTHQDLDLGDAVTAPQIVEALLRRTLERGASDLHLLPTREGLQVEWRVDGVVQRLGLIDRDVANNVTTRLKVLAGLLTYETNKPQEGRLRAEGLDRPMRISTLPTVFGERIVARVLSEDGGELLRLGDLTLPKGVADTLSQALAATSGAVLIVGPSGSGKTTTAYACLREIQSRWGGGRSVVTLEDPVEVVLPGVAQSQANPDAGYDLATALRSLVRQDPDVLFVGEMRDAEAARIAYQAAMTGQLLLTTLHATDAATAIARLLDMGAPPYLVRGATRAIVAQRLLRKVCECRQGDAALPDCPRCDGVGYDGRLAIAESIDLADTALARSIDSGYDRARFNEERRAAQSATLMDQAAKLVHAGLTDQLEVDRVLGWEVGP
ncbi:Type II secretion system protein E [Planctomycetes bacterium MalM25]|nr:Type II secretion system protein E [Planctomycetes bacterium MalM25]